MLMVTTIRSLKHEPFFLVWAEGGNDNNIVALQ